MHVYMFHMVFTCVELRVFIVLLCRRLARYCRKSAVGDIFDLQMNKTHPHICKEKDTHTHSDTGVLVLCGDDLQLNRHVPVADF